MEITINTNVEMVCEPLGDVHGRTGDTSDADTCQEAVNYAYEMVHGFLTSMGYVVDFDCNFNRWHSSVYRDRKITNHFMSFGNSISDEQMQTLEIADKLYQGYVALYLIDNEIDYRSLPTDEPIAYEYSLEDLYRWRQSILDFAKANETGARIDSNAQEATYLPSTH